MRRRQLEKLGVEAKSRISPLLQKCCLCLSANESFSQAEQDLFLLTGMKVGHSTLQRQVYREKEHLDFPDSPVAINEVCLDGGKVRLRTESLGEKCSLASNPRSTFIVCLLWGNIAKKRRINGMDQFPSIN